MLFTLLIWLVSVFIGLGVLAWMIGIRYIPHNKVGILEKMWSFKGSLKEGKLIALEKEAGYQAEVLRGGLHFMYSPLQYKMHKLPLVEIGEGRIGYIYARDGEPLPPTQTLGQIVDSDGFQDAVKFLQNGGQRGRQRDIIREGVYAINLAQFVVITEDNLYTGPIQEEDHAKYLRWQEELLASNGFRPVIIGSGSNAPDQTDEKDKLVLTSKDNIGIITVHDGNPLPTGEIIAPEVIDPNNPVGHNCYQNPEKFLSLGGRRGKQLQVLTDGTYFINRWFATVEKSPKTLIPIGYVGVVVSFFGKTGEDVTGVTFRYGEQVEPGNRGIWKQALRPGKYALNPYAMTVELVPTTNFVLRWITGQTEEHQYDKELTSIELITADGYEPTLPLSLILHIDYEKAPRVVQRFGNIHRLISQTLDPILSAYFRDVAQNTNMLDLLIRREEIQKIATQELSRRFKEYDINCVAVLIGRPETKNKLSPSGEDPIEKLFDQLRTRRAAEEQLITYAKQETAAKKLRELKDAQATAEKQTELTQTKINIEIAANKGDAMVAESKRLAEREVALAQGTAKSKEILGQGEGRARELQGKGEAQRINDIGMSEAAVFAKKVQAYGDPRLFAILGMTEKLSGFTQPLVPERVLLMNPGSNGHAKESGVMGLFNQLLSLMVAEKYGMGENGVKTSPDSPKDTLTD